MPTSVGEWCAVFVMIVLILALAVGGIYNMGHRNGQLDALTGKVKWEKITLQDETTGWVRTGSPRRVYRIIVTVRSSG